MLKIIKLDRVDEKIKKFLIKLKVDEDQYILEMSGKPLMGVVPPWQIEETKQKKDNLSAMLKGVWSKTKEIPQKEVEKEVKEAVTAIRKGL